MLELAMIIAGGAATYGALRSRLIAVEKALEKHINHDETYHSDISKKHDAQFKRIDSLSNRCTILEQNSTHHLDLNTAEEKFVSKKELDLRLRNIEIEARHTSKTVDKIEGKLEQVLFALSGGQDDKKLEK